MDGIDAEAEMQRVRDSEDWDTIIRAQVTDGPIYGRKEKEHCLEVNRNIKDR